MHGEEKTDQDLWLYRGIRGDHPALAAARQGVVVPGQKNGVVTPEEHNLDLDDAIARSPFTSWTWRKSLAQVFAAKAEGGLILRLPSLPLKGDGWQWEESPDEFQEDELLLRGVRIDAEVLS